MPDQDALLKKWNQRHSDPEVRPRAAEVLSQNQHLLPARGWALDLACGLGGNALLMARAGLEVAAWDLSPVAIERLRTVAEEQGLTNLHPGIRDLSSAPLPRNAFDVISVGYFLDRALIQPIIRSLKPGGLVFYQTFTRVSTSGLGPSNPDFRLADNELLRLFSSLKIRFYREENLLGDLSQGTRDVAMLVGEKVVN